MKKRNKLWLIIPVMIPLLGMAMFKPDESGNSVSKMSEAFPYANETVSLQKNCSFNNTARQGEAADPDIEERESPEETAEKTEGNTQLYADSAYTGTEDLQNETNKVTMPADEKKNVQEDTTNDKKEYLSSDNAKKKESPHVHDWIPVTEVKHHDAEYETVHHDAVTEEVRITDSQAWTEYIYKDICVCNECGYSSESYEELDSHFWDAHDYEYSGWHSESVLEKTIEHPEEFHYETRTISEAYDEQVVTKQAYDETIITGYKCATCGERK